MNNLSGNQLTPWLEHSQISPIEMYWREPLIYLDGTAKPMSLL